jgi:hypothetical protein
LSIVTEYSPQCGIEDFIWRAENKMTTTLREIVAE